MAKDLNFSTLLLFLLILISLCIVVPGIKASASYEYEKSPIMSRKVVRIEKENLSGPNVEGAEHKDFDEVKMEGPSAKGPGHKDIDGIKMEGHSAEG